MSVFSLKSGIISLKGDEMFENELTTRFNALKKASPERFPLMAMEYVVFIGLQKNLTPLFDKLYKEKWFSDKLINYLNYCYQYYLDFVSDEALPKASFDTDFIDANSNVRENTNKKMILALSKNQGRKSSLEQTDTETMRNELNLLEKTLRLAQHTCNYDPKNSTLRIDEEEVVISKKNDSLAPLVLKTIFKNRKAEWQYGDIHESLSGAYELSSENNYDKEKDSNKYYHVARDINTKVLKETGYNNFLVFNKTAMKISDTFLH
jgi:hypothetical protein